MPSAPNNPQTPQLTLNFEPSLPDRFATLRDFIAYRIQVQAKPAKSIAADMDISPSTLSRKLAPGDGDTQRFNVDDLERYMAETHDFSAIEYLASKYLYSDSARKLAAIARVESLSAELVGLIGALRANV